MFPSGVADLFPLSLGSLRGQGEENTALQSYVTIMVWENRPNLCLLVFYTIFLNEFIFLRLYIDSPGD